MLGWPAVMCCERVEEKYTTFGLTLQRNFAVGKLNRGLYSEAMDTRLRKEICPKGLAHLANHLGVSYQAVHKWFRKGKIPAERVLAVEAATGVSRHRLRSDLYPDEPLHLQEGGVMRHYDYSDRDIDRDELSYGDG